MKKRAFRFYTKQEVRRIKQVYEQTNSQVETGRILAAELGRTPASIQMKASNMFGRNNVRSIERETKSSDNGFTIPQGFTFDIKPSKAVMFKDHVRLYF